MSETEIDDKKKLRPVIIWLLLGCVMIFSMVIVGGVTRLTGSGLSISDYRLVTGTVPPLNDADWQTEFEKYKLTPQYKKVNFNFTIDDFKNIYWWEYIHRLLGRLIGILFIVPFLFFLFKKMIPPKIIPGLLLILLLGAFQGYLGWYMVESGLIDKPSVSHFRLAAHLLTAFLTFAFTFWIALDLMADKFKKPTGLQLYLYKIAVFCLIILVVQITYGAFVAGLKAGYIYNTWPKMGEEWIATSVFASIKNQGSASLTNDISVVQFIHRYLAYILVIAVAFLWLKALSPDFRTQLSSPQKRSINAAIIFVALQFTLGVLTLVYKVPISLGVIHQLGAMALFATLIWAIHSLRRNTLEV